MYYNRYKKGFDFGDFEVTKREIMYYCPDISETTIEIALRELKDNGVIEKIGGGRYTKYRYKRK